MLEHLIAEGRRDAHRSWHLRTSGGVLVALVAGASMLIIELAYR